MRPRFIQNMRVSCSCSNRAIYLRRHATPLARHWKSWRSRPRSECESSLPDPDQFESSTAYSLLLELLSANHIDALSHANVVFYHGTFLIPRGYSVRENYLNLRWDLLVSLLLAILFLPNGCEKLLDVVPSANYLCTYLIERINYRITNTAYRPLWTNLNSLNNKFWIVTTKRVIVITYRLGEWVFHIRWHQHHKHKTYSDLLSRIDAKKSYFAWISNIPSCLFVGNHVVSRQTDEYAKQKMGAISCTLTNFKKLK